jgi:acid phosphatase
VRPTRAARCSALALLLVLALTAWPAGGAAGAARGKPRPAAVPRLAHVVVIVFENREDSTVLGSGSDTPTFHALAARYARVTRYDAVAHPSLPNYLALVSGSTQGVTSDCTTCSAHGSSIGTLLDRARLSWGAFAEGYPSSSRFAKKHVPFLYFAGQEAHVKPLGALDPHKLPAYAFVVPDLCDDMHDCPTATGDAWLASFVRPLLRVPRTAIFITFDEGTSDAGGGGHVATIVAGTAVRPHSATARPASHYSLLRTVEDALGLPHLGASAHAVPITGIWR